MADLKISELPELLAQQLQASDPIAIVDLSGSTTKKISAENLLVGGIALVPDGTIPPEKLSGTTVADGSITTAKLADKSVTAAKLADSSATLVTAALPATGAFIGQQAVVTGGAINIAYVFDGTSWVSEGGIQALAGNTSGLVNTYVTTSGFSAEVSADIDQTTAAGQFLAGPTSGAGPIEQRIIAPSDLPTAGVQKGGVAINGNGLAMVGDTAVIDNTVTANPTQAYVVQYDEHGLVIGGAPISPVDLPLATDSNVGVVIPGEGLAVDVDGALNIDNSVVPATATKITYNSNGLVISGSDLLPSDIPELSADIIVAGEFGSAQIGEGSITREKLADYSIAYIQEAEPSAVTADYIGLLWYQESTGQLRMFNGNSFMPVGFGRLSNDNLRWGGIIDATTGLVTGVTASGTTAGLTVGAPLPEATDNLGGLYVLVGVAGNNIAVTSGVSYDAGDWCLCINENEGWVRIDLAASGGGGGGATNLGDLLDVTISTPTSGQLLQLQASNQWQNVTLTAADLGGLVVGDNVSELVNDAGYLTNADLPADAVISVNGKSGIVVLTATDIGALQAGDDISELNNDAGYITAADIPALNYVPTGSWAALPSL